MRYEKVIHRVKSGEMSRADLRKLKRNAEDKLAGGDDHAREVLRALDHATPSDSYILFMGFCPGANFSRRLDVDWKKQGICRFDYVESEQQLERFNTICPGDLVILKKREKFGRTMMLYGHGRVRSVTHDENECRYLLMNWSDQNEIIRSAADGLQFDRGHKNDRRGRRRNAG